MASHLERHFLCPFRICSLTFSSSFSISPARITSGPRTAYSMAMKLGLMLSKDSDFSDDGILLLLENELEVELRADSKLIFYSIFRDSRVASSVANLAGFWPDLAI